MMDLSRALRSGDTAIALTAACNLAYARGLVSSLSGNASCRLAGGFLCTPTARCLGEVQAEDLVPLDEGWRALTAGRPSSEWRLHAAVYRALPEVGAVIHTHSPAATVMAVRGREVSPLTPEMEHFLGCVPCLPFAPPGTEEVGAGVAKAIAGGARAALLGRHGAVAWGPDVRRAYYQAELLEAACTLAATMVQAGGTPQ